MFVSRVEELATATVDELDAVLAEALRVRDRAEADIAAVVAVVDSRQLFRDHGQSSIKAYVKQQLNCSGPDALRIKRRARLFTAHPDIADVFAHSEIAVGQVDAMAKAQQHPRAGEQFPMMVNTLLSEAQHLEHEPFSKAVDHFIVTADQDGAFNDQAFHIDQRTASVRVGDGALDLTATGGDPIAAAEMKRVFDLACQGEFRADVAARRAEHGDDADSHPLPRSAAQRRFDALHAIFLASVTAPADGKRPEPLVNIVIDPSTSLHVLAKHGLIDLDLDTDTSVNAGAPFGFSDEFDAPDMAHPASRRCATSTGVDLHPDAALRAMISGRVRRVVVDAHDVVIDMGRSQRLFTGSARQAAQLLVTTCGYRGCDVAAELCDVDHIDPWSAGGATDQANSMPLCGKHDRVKHRHRLRGRRDVRGRIHLIRPDGSVIKPLNAPDPTWADSELARHRTPTAQDLGWTIHHLDLPAA